MTEDELAGEPGAVATRADQGEDAAGDAAKVEPIFKPRDFRLNLEARLSGTAEPIADLDSPEIRKLTWETVVPDRPAADSAPGPSAPRTSTPDPLPPPRSVAPPVPPPAAKPPDLPATDAPVEPEVAAAPTAPVVEAPEAVVAVEAPPEAAAAVEIVAGEPVAAEPAPEAAPVDVVARTVSEENRLALVPDLVEDDSPVELPQINPSGPIVVPQQSVYAPVLAESYYVAPVRPAATPTPSSLAMMIGTDKAQIVKKKHKRHLFRSFVTLVLLFGLLAGGAYAAKTYLLKQTEWAVEVKPLADDVATARGLEFKEAIEVTTLPVGDYAKRLAGSVNGVRADRAPVWRALGLLNGEFDLEVIGRQAMNDSPAFYDPSSKTIVVAADLQTYGHLYRFAMHRALTTALLDQQYDWSSRISTASPAAALGMHAVIDADALHVANTLAAADGPDQLAPELTAFVQGHSATPSPSPYASTIIGRPGAALRTLVGATTDATALAGMEQGTPSDDSRFDAARPQATTPALPATQGMMFWYYVLASRIDDTQAWSAAIRWTGDSVATSTGEANQCVDAKVATGSPEDQAAMLAAFQSWAAVAPAESTTTVVPVDGNQVAIRACDPGATVTAPIPTKVPVAFGGAGVERALVDAAVSAASGATVDPVCLVNAARQRGTALAMPADDVPVVAVGWQPAYVAANLDLGVVCVTPTG